jgi:hypothetical protein
MNRSTTMKHTRTRAAALLVAIVGLLTVVAPPPAHAADFTVQQGQSVLLCDGCSLLQEALSVSPAEAGTALRLSPSGVRFDASPTFVGLATVTRSDSSPQVWTIEVRGDRASASGTFTPVGRPGPCLLVTAGTTVAFGDVELGGAVVQGDVSPTLQGCAPADVTVDVVAQATDASGAAGTLQNLGDTCTATITLCVPIGVGFVVAGNGLPLDDSVLGSLLFARDGDFQSSVGVSLRLTDGVPLAQQGSPFSFDIIFTAIPA